ETTFPSLDAGSKDPVFLTVTAQPGSTRDAGPGGTLPPDNGPSKNLMAANFKLDIKGLPTQRVSKIDAFTVKSTGTSTTVSNLNVTLAASDAQAWSDWFEDFVIKGNNGDGAERQGLITYLDSTLKGVLGTVELHNIGIRRLTAVDNGGGVAQVTAEL